MCEVMDGLSKLTDMLLRMADSIVKLSSFTEEQGTFNSLVSSKLECLIKLTKRVKYLEPKTALLKSCLSKEVDALKSNCDLRQSAHENELIISGIPDTIKGSPQHIVGSVLSALHTSDVSSEISDIRVLNCKPTLTSDSTLCSNKVYSTTSNRIASTIESPSLKTNGTKAIIVSFKSVQARNRVINHKRVKRDLSVKEVFSNDTCSKIYVNEILSCNEYALLTRCRAKARELGYKYVWVRSGKIAVRRDEGKPIVHINTLPDIEMLTLAVSLRLAWYKT